MTVLIRNVRAIDILADIDTVVDAFIGPGFISLSPKKITPRHIIDGRNLILVPGLIDLHVHFREPGFIYKEDICSGIKAALAGGVTSALVMPNTHPAIDSLSRVDYQIRRKNPVNFDLMVAGAASENLAGLKPSSLLTSCKAPVKAVTDDGRPILDETLMKNILRRCRFHNIVCMQHAEDIFISQHASINEGHISRRFNIAGQPKKAEYDLIARDIELAKKIQARYHILHLSCKESLQIVRKAKRSKALVTCEVAPHHLLLSQCDIRSLDPNKKMNPPLRSKTDVEALLEGLHDGSIDAVASDHAPHSRREKRRPFTEAPFGVVGLESTILVLLTLVKRGLSLKRAIASMTTGPARVLQDPRRGCMLHQQALKNAVLIDPNYQSMFSIRNLAGRSINSAFFGMELFGQVKATFLDGQIVFSRLNNI